MNAPERYGYLRAYCVAACDPAADDDDAIHNLAAELDKINPGKVPPDRDLLDAARTYLELRHTGESSPYPVPWAEYAHRAAEALHGPGHEVTQDMASLLADVYLETGNPFGSLHWRGRVLEGTTVATLPWARQQMARAETLHVLGVCGEALAAADAVLTQWQPADDRDRYALGTGLLMSYLKLTDGCGDIARVRRLLAAHRTLLPPTGDISWELHVLFVRTEFGRPGPNAAHRLVCDNQPSDGRLRDTLGDRDTAVRDLILNALGDTRNADFPGLHELFNQQRLTGLADEALPTERKS
jgi:hypothetical protein